MKIDLHLHTNASRDCLTDPTRVVEAARRRGLDGVAVTDHDSASSWDAVIGAANGLTVIRGEEIFTSEGEIIGLFLSREIPRGLAPVETAEAIREQGGVVIVPHPFDRVRKGPLTRAPLDELVDAGLVDAIEVFNARTAFAADNAAAAAYAEAHGLPAVAGSDAHTAAEVGAAYTELPVFSDAATFLASLREAKIAGKRSPLRVHVTTALAKRWKRNRVNAA
jgi:predicted metal-dependent phosphoesterase TrpH